jgi:hypothetical protein
MLGEMTRRYDEANYVLSSLRRARETVSAHPEWFEPAALQRIEQATASVEEARRTAVKNMTQSNLINH